MSSVLGEAAAHPALHLVPQRRPRTLIEATPTSLRCRQKQRPGLRSALDRLATHPRAVHRRGILMRCPLYLSHQARPRATANPAARANHGQTRGKNLGASCLPMPALYPDLMAHGPHNNRSALPAGKRGGRAGRTGEAAGLVAACGGRGRVPGRVEHGAHREDLEHVHDRCAVWARRGTALRNAVLRNKKKRRHELFNVR